MAHTVINCTVYRDNPYQSILYSRIGKRYQCKKGTVEDAIALQTAEPKQRQLLHVHWEEAVIRPMRSSVEAHLAAEQFAKGLARFKKLGGRVAWTVHNLAPHEQEHPEAFAWLRRALVEHADRILIHSVAAIPELSRAHRLPAERLFLLPHASYADVYTPLVGVAQPEPSYLLIFGKIRRYKGINAFLELYSESGLAEHGIRLRVCGEPLAAEHYGEELAERFGSTDGVSLEFRRFEDHELGALFGAATAVILPYERFLTSGVLLAAMTLGVPSVAPDLAQMREVLPPGQHHLLYDPTARGSILDSIKQVAAISPHERVELRRELLERAAYYSPERISLLLGNVYDEMRS